jgi:hypothetical protein
MSITQNSKVKSIYPQPAGEALVRPFRNPGQFPVEYIRAIQFVLKLANIAIAKFGCAIAHPLNTCYIYGGGADNPYRVQSPVCLTNLIRHPTLLFEMR